jgi:hypothetical protein
MKDHADSLPDKLRGGAVIATAIGAVQSAPSRSALCSSGG